MKLLPQPKQVNISGESFDLTALQTICAAGCDGRVIRAASDLTAEIEPLIGRALPCGDAGDGIGITVIHGDDGDGYTLSVEEDGITVRGQGAAGAFYGIGTLRQLLREYGSALPLCRITDEPDFRNRGFYHDITRGMVPTLEQLCRIADTLASYKINSLQLYVEDAFAFDEYRGIIAQDAMLTADEIRRFDDYCHDRFIELIPSLSTFGHLYNLLQSDRYRHLCELEDYQPQHHYWIEKMLHHTIDVSNPESISLIFSLLDQYIPLFRSDKFNICCDETFDLCTGRNRGKDAGEEYFTFVNRIIEHVRSYGKTVMMWGDIVCRHPERISELPQDVILLNWDYAAAPGERCARLIAENGRRQIVCPGTSTWSRFVEAIDISVPNITGLIAIGRQYGAEGVLNTNWGDFGNECVFTGALFGMAVGASTAWNTTVPVDDAFIAAANLHLYGQTAVDVVSMIRDAGNLEAAAGFSQLVWWYSNRYITHAEDTDPAPEPEQVVAGIRMVESHIDRLTALGDASVALRDLRTAFIAIVLMAKLALCIKGDSFVSDRTALKEDVCRWLAEYRKLWLRDNKPSDLHRIEEFISTLLTCL